MFKLLILIVGMFIGWNFPQPLYAKAFQNWVTRKWKEKFGKKEEE